MRGIPGHQVAGCRWQAKEFGFVHKEISWVSDATRGRVSCLPKESSQEGAVECWVGVEDLWGKERCKPRGLMQQPFFSGQSCS